MSLECVNNDYYYYVYKSNNNKSKKTEALEICLCYGSRENLFQGDAYFMSYASLFLSHFNNRAAFLQNVFKCLREKRTYLN